MAYGKVRVDQVQSSTRTVDVDSLATTAVATQSVAGLLSATDKTKLDGVAAGAEVNVNADWSAGSGDAQILNKPTLGTAAAKNTGTAAGNVVELDGSARLPAVDGSQLTGINAATDLTYTAATRVLASSTGTDATLTLVTSTDAGLAPASGGGTTNFLRADGTFAAPPGGSPGGSTTQFQYNNAGAFGGLSTFTTDGTSVTLTGRFISSLNGAASAPPGTFTGTWYTGGTATTTKPHLLIEPTGATSTGWSTSGTGFGVNAASGFAGNLLDLQLNGTSRFKVLGTGAATFSSTVVVSSDLLASTWIGLGGAAASAGWIKGQSDGIIGLYNNATTGFNRIQFGGTTSSFPALKRNSAVLETKLADDSAYAQHAASVFQAATAHTVATLPGTPAVGMVARVTDATAPAVGVTVVGGGAAAALVWYNGANWSVIGV